MIRATLWDFGGVILSSPFDSFARYERAHRLPDGFIRQLNATNPHTNAWAHLERGDISFDEFCSRFEAEAREAGHELDAREVMNLLRGEVRPAMVEALRRCHERLKTALLTNNFMSADGPADFGPVLDHFDVIVESRHNNAYQEDEQECSHALSSLRSPLRS